MMNRPETLADAPLGRESSYPEHYDPALLYPIARAANRAPLGIVDDLDGDEHGEGHRNRQPQDLPAAHDLSR